VGCDSCRDGDPLNADELKTLLGRTLDFETQFNRFANALRDLIQGSCLRVASRELRYGGAL